MPLIRTIQINEGTKIGIWKILEPESYFLTDISLQKKISHAQKRTQHLAGRKLLRMLETEFPVNEIQILSSGKPCLEDAAFNFSISHSGDYAVAIVSQDYKVGIDVEKITPRLQKIAPRFLNEEEYREMPSDIITYALCWSAKEAVYKWYGEEGILLRSNIFLTPFEYVDKGTIECMFRNEKTEKELQLHYQVGKEFVLVWVVD